MGGHPVRLLAWILDSRYWILDARYKVLSKISCLLSNGAGEGKTIKNTES